METDPRFVNQKQWLTSDIVWLVNQTVTLPDGTQQTVLVPQVYAKLKEGDLTGDGALLGGGTFTSPVGIPFEKRALPSYSANAPYNVYEVLRPIDDVSKSKILPWFGQPGQGTQYELPKPVQWYLDKGYLGDKK